MAVAAVQSKRLTGERGNLLSAGDEPPWGRQPGSQPEPEQQTACGCGLRAVNCPGTRAPSAPKPGPALLFLAPSRAAGALCAPAAAAATEHTGPRLPTADRT